MAAEYKHAIVDLSNNITTVTTAPVLLAGWYVNTVLSAHAVNIEDGTDVVFTLPASLAAGTLKEPPPTRFETSLIVDPHDSSTGNLTVIYRDLK